jgi:RimJ/RimL family protein N-acetyltransferase
LGKGLAKMMINHIEDFAVENNIKSIKADTNFDNDAMLNIFEKLGYKYCGQVHLRGNPRRAFEKVLN